MTDEELLNKPTAPVRSRLSKKQLVATVALLATLLVLTLFSQPIYQTIKHYRADRLVQKAKKLMEQKAFQEAFHSAMAAYHMSPQSAEAIRTVARLLQGREESLAFWKLLVTSDEAGIADYETYLRHANQFGNPDHAELAASNLLEHGRDQQSALWLLAEYFLAKGDLETSTQFLKEALSLNPLNEASRFYLVRQLLQRGQPKDLEEARAHLRTLLSNQGEYALRALEIILATETIDPHQATAYQALLDAIDEPAEAKQIVRLRLNLLSQRDQIEALEKARADVDQNTVEENTEIAKLLRQEGRYEEVVDMLPLYLALTHSQLFQARLDSLADLAKQKLKTDENEGRQLWLQVYAELGHKLSPLPPVTTEIFLARAARESQRSALERLHWRKAHQLTDEIKNSKIILAQYAESLGATNEAFKAYRDMVDQKEGGFTPYQQLARLSKQQKRTLELKGLMQEMKEAFPDDEAYQNDYLYLSFLLGNETADHLAEAEALYQENPSFLSHRTTLALGYLRNRQPKKAYSMFQGMEPRLWEKASASMQVVHVATQATVGNTSVARTFAERIPTANLLPEELALLEQAITANP